MSSPHRIDAVQTFLTLVERLAHGDTGVVIEDSRTLDPPTVDAIVRAGRQGARDGHRLTVYGASPATAAALRFAELNGWVELVSRDRIEATTELELAA